MMKYCHFLQHGWILKRAKRVKYMLTEADQTSGGKHTMPRADDGL